MPINDDGASSSELIDARIAELGDWRGEWLARVRALIHQAAPAVVETVKWRKPSNPDGVPVWELDGMICTGETYKGKVKLTFAQGAALDDPAGVFNASLSAGTRRAIDLREGDDLNEDAFRALVAAAVAHNAGRVTETRGRPVPKEERRTSRGVGPRLLAGGNPQIPKGDGDAPVQAYIDAMPGWKSDVGRHLDALIEQAVPELVKAVRWNQPMYGVTDQGFFASFRCFTHYIKLTFFAGAELDPVPPVDFKDPNEKAFHIHEDDELDDQQLLSWVEQAAAIPGWTP